MEYTITQNQLYLNSNSNGVDFLPISLSAADKTNGASIDAMAVSYGTDFIDAWKFGASKVKTSTIKASLGFTI